MITTDKTQLNINVLTQEQYEQAKADETLDQDGLYMVNDDIHQMGVELDFNGLYKRELVWENPNPTSAFGPQLIGPGSSGWVGTNPTSYYDNFLVTACHKDGGWTSFALMIENVIQLSGVDTNNRFRNIYVTESGFDFNAAYSFVTYNSWTTTMNNDFLVPQKIYGIKKLQPSYNVIPQQADYVVDNNNGKRVWKSGKVDDYNEYSTEEKRIGTWIDGKPLYRRTFIGNYAHDTILMDGVDTVVSVKGSVYYGPDAVWYPIPFIIGSGATVQEANIIVNLIGKLAVVALKNSNVTSYEFKAIVEYTKTTD